MTFGKKLRQ